MSNPRISQLTPSQPVLSTPGVEGASPSHAKHKHKAPQLFQDSTFGQADTSQPSDASALLSGTGQGAGSGAQVFAGLSDDDQATLLGHSQSLANATWAAVGVTPPFAPTASDGGDSPTTSAAATFAVPQGRSLAQASIQTPGVYDGSGAGAATGTGAVASTGSSTAPLNGAVQNTLTALQSTNGNSTFDTNVAQTAYLGLLGLDTDLKNYAQVVQNQLSTANTARTQFSTIQDTVANWPPNTDTIQFTWTELDGSGQAVQKSGALTQDQAQAKLDSLQQTISQLGDQTQEQQLTLQDLTNKYQQGVETLTNVLKFQFDTTKSIISNIKT